METTQIEQGGSTTFTQSDAAGSGFSGQPAAGPLPPAQPLAGPTVQRGRGVPLAAWILITIGAIALLGNFGWWDGKLWPLILVVIGVFLIMRRRG